MIYQRKELILLKVLFINIIIELLIKDPKKRITLKEILQHPWLINDSKEIMDARRNSLPGEEFSVFSMVKPKRPSLFKKVNNEVNNAYQDSIN